MSATTHGLNPKDGVSRSLQTNDPAIKNVDTSSLLLDRNPSDADRPRHETHSPTVSVHSDIEHGEVHTPAEPPEGRDLFVLVFQIVAAGRRRTDYLIARRAINQRALAVCRRMVISAQPDISMAKLKDEASKLFDACVKGKPHPLAESAALSIAPHLRSAADLERSEDQMKAVMERLAKQLPVWKWVEGVRGVGALGLANIIAETGDLSNYSTVSKLWKRLGMAVMDGVRQGGLPKGAPAAEWVKHGYSGMRRSVMWNIGEGFIKQGDHYREVYDERRAVEVEKAHAEGLRVATTTKATCEKWTAAGLDVEHVSKLTSEHRGCGHIHNRAKRYAEKRFLRDLWAAWRSS